MKSRTKTAVDTRTVIRLVSRSFPRSRVESVTELTEGMFNTVFLITGTGLPEGEVILKIGPEAGTPLLTYEKDILRAEVRAYRLLEGKGLPVPRVFASCFDRELIACDYFFMSRLEGVLWKDAEPRRLAESRPALMEELGRINRTIHSVTGPFFGYLREEARFSYATWAEAFTGMVDDLLEDGRKRRCRLPYEEIRQTVAEKTDLLNRIKIPRLVDFDLWAGNVFLEEEGNGYRISGVMDLERCFFGDADADLTSAVGIFDDVEEEPDFLRGYGENVPDPAAETRMELYRLYMSLIVYVEAYRYDEGYRRSVRRYAGKRLRQQLDRLRGM